MHCKNIEIYPKDVIDAKDVSFSTGSGAGFSLAEVLAVGNNSSGQNIIVTGNVTISGAVTANALHLGTLDYPVVDGTSGQVMYTDGGNTLAFKTITVPPTPTLAAVLTAGNYSSGQDVNVTGSLTVTGSIFLSGVPTFQIPNSIFHLYNSVIDYYYDFSMYLHTYSGYWGNQHITFVHESADASCWCIGKAYSRDSVTNNFFIVNGSNLRTSSAGDVALRCGTDKTVNIPNGILYTGKGVISSGNVIVSGNLDVTGNLQVSGSVTVYDYKTGIPATYLISNPGINYYSDMAIRISTLPNVLGNVETQYVNHSTSQGNWTIGKTENPADSSSIFQIVQAISLRTSSGTDLFLSVTQSKHAVFPNGFVSVVRNCAVVSAALVTSGDITTAFGGVSASDVGRGFVGQYKNVSAVSGSYAVYSDGTNWSYQVLTIL